MQSTKITDVNQLRKTLRKTLQQKMCAGLMKLGWTEDKTDKSRARAFFMAGMEGELARIRYYVGMHGTLRVGMSMSDAVPAPQDLYDKFYQAGGGDDA